jgi:hypothetical protein
MSYASIDTVCDPSGRPEYVMPDLHGVIGAPSSPQSNPPGSLEVM